MSVKEEDLKEHCNVDGSLCCDHSKLEVPGEPRLLKKNESAEKMSYGEFESLEMGEAAAAESSVGDAEERKQELVEKESGHVLPSQEVQAFQINIKEAAVEEQNHPPGRN